MGNQQSRQRYTKGDYSGNTGSHNITGSNNTIYYPDHGDRNSSQNYDKILQQLYKYPPGSGYKSHRNRVPEPVEGTCTWVTGHQKYKEWLEHKTSGLLWLSADPGCGKSVIASFLVGHLTQTGAIVCYFFFKDDNEEQKSATFALRALLHQLFVQRPNLCSYAEGAFKAQGSNFAEEVDTLWDILVKATTEGECGDVICVVDALDECEEATISPLIRHITRLSESQPSAMPLRFLVTSRPYHRIETKLSSPATTIRLKGEAEVGAITADVTRVIDNGIGELESYWGQVGGLEYLRDLLKLSADRTFLWVSLVLEILKASQDDSPEEFTNIIRTTPRDLPPLYTKILDKSADPIKARRILNIVVAAVRPLTLREMNVAFRIRQDHTTIKDLGDASPGFEKTVKNLCGLFVRVIDEKIYLIHQTAREFLIKGSSLGHGNWQYTIRYMDSNFILADICLSYLSLEDFEKDLLPIGAYRPYGDASNTRDKYVQEPALLDYAATHWPDHIRGARDRQMELLKSIKRICERKSNRFLIWMGERWRIYDQYRPFPDYFTHLMIASWLGQAMVVERLLGEGGDNARSEECGAALDIPILRHDQITTRVLVQGQVEAFIGGLWYNISKMTSDEFTRRVDERRQDEEDAVRRFSDFAMSKELEEALRKRMEEVLEARRAEDYLIEFLKPFCLPDPRLEQLPGQETHLVPLTHPAMD